MNPKEQGIALIMFLIILGVSTLLVLSQMRTIILLKQQLQQAKQKTALFHSLEQAFETLKPSLGLNRQGTIGLIQYQISDLGVEDCLLIGAKASHHWEIKLWHSLLRLEIRFAKAGNPHKCHDPLYRIIKAGIQSWEYH